MEQNENSHGAEIAPGQHPQQVEIDNDLKALPGGRFHRRKLV